MENTYKLNYFEGNGRASNIRAILDYSKAKWEQVFINFGEWPALKASGKFENGQLPVLEVNGKQYTQTIAIETYLAKLFGLMGSNAEEEYQINNILCSREDYTKPLFEFIMPSEEQKTRREAIIKNLAENVLPNLAAKYEAKYVANGAGKYFLGDKFSLADIFFATTFTQIFEQSNLKEFFGSVPSKSAPKLAELIKRIKSEELNNYFDKTYIKTSIF